MMVKGITSKSGWTMRLVYLSAMLLVVFVLAGCSSAATPVVPTAVPATATQAATATELPATPTEAPTATQQPTATTAPTQPPTATAVPALALLPDGGFNVWCAPVSYEGSLPTSPDAPQDARLLTVKNNENQVIIPAAYCTVVYRFNQAAPTGLQVVFYDGSNPFLKLPLTPAEGHPDEAWATVRHEYVIHYPQWFVTYKIALAGADGKEITSTPVKFTKVLPPTCIYTNQLPDIKTGWCPISDPWEVEPHPDAKYPYDHSRLLTPQPKP